MNIDTRWAGIAATVILALVSLPFLVTAPAGAAGAGEPAGMDTGWLRVGHLSPGTGAADVRLTPFSGGSNVMLSDVAYGEVSDFKRLTAGLYTVAVVPAGSDMSVNPMISKSVRIEPGSASTLIASGPRDALKASIISDDLTAPQPGTARVRLIAATSGNRAVTAQVVGGPTLADAATPGTVTGYASVAAQDWKIQVSTSGASTNGGVDLRSGGVYSLFVLDEASGGVRLMAVQDAQGTATMPTGGVDTGGGGLARPARSAILPAGVAGGLVGLVVVAVGAGALARSRPGARR